MPQLIKDEDYTVDEKMHAVPITEKGVAKTERLLGVQNLYDPSNLELTHQLQAALKAKELFRKDEQYVVQDGEIIIVDEFTGRLMHGRRYSDGIHQAIEAKEGIKVKSEDQTLATITFQNYFRLYGKLAGMTGTAKTEEREFRDIYGLDVLVIPTNMAVARKDHDDVVYKNEDGKFSAVINEIVELHNAGQPVLVGTRSIEKSERLAGHARQARHRAQRAQRQVPREGSRDHQGRRAARQGHDRHEHGGPRRGHQARRRGARTSAVCTSSAPSGTSRGASTISCAAGPDAKAIRVRHVSTSGSTTS